MGTLVHGVDRYEYRRIADRRRRHPTNHRLDVAVPGHVGVVEHDLAPGMQLAGAIGLAFHEAVDELALEVAGPRTLRQLETGIADRIVDAVDVERVLHHR